jgi:hypothetical protein
MKISTRKIQTAIMNAEKQKTVHHVRSDAETQMASDLFLKNGTLPPKCDHETGTKFKGSKPMIDTKHTPGPWYGS